MAKYKYLIILILLSCIDINYPKSDISKLKSAVITSVSPGTATEVFSDVTTVFFDVTIHELNNRAKTYEWYFDGLKKYGEDLPSISLNIANEELGVHTLEFSIIDTGTGKEIDYRKWYLSKKERSIKEYLQVNNTYLLYVNQEQYISSWNETPILTIGSDGSSLISNLLSQGFKVSFFADDVLIYTTSSLYNVGPIDLATLLPSFKFSNTGHYPTYHQISAKILYQGAYLNHTVVWKIMVAGIDSPIIVEPTPDSPPSGNLETAVNNTYIFDVLLPTNLDKRTILIEYLFNNNPILNCPAYFAHDKTHCTFKVTGPGILKAMITNTSSNTNPISYGEVVWNIIIN